MYDGENTMLLGDYYCDEVAGGLTEDAYEPKLWDDLWDRDELANAVYNTGDEWMKELKPEDRERVIDRLGDYLGWMMIGSDFPFDKDREEKYKPGCVALVRGMLNDAGYGTENMIWKLLARMFRDDGFDSSDEEIIFFRWFKKKYEGESWTWVRRTLHIDDELKM